MDCCFTLLLLIGGGPLSLEGLRHLIGQEELFRRLVEAEAVLGLGRKPLLELVRFW